MRAATLRTRRAADPARARLEALAIEGDAVEQRFARAMLAVLDERAERARDPDAYSKKLHTKLRALLAQ